MQIEWLVKDRNDRLVILFLGWSCDANTVKNLHLEGYDILILYDYRDMDISALSAHDLSGYRHTALVAWSFGVWVAESSAYKLPAFDQAVAINGTTQPVDDEYGINRKVFAITLKGVEKGGTDRFNQKMYGTKSELIPASSRPLPEQVDELKLLSTRFIEPVQETIAWSDALVAGNDFIFPPAHMRDFWNKRGIFVTVLPEMNHYPFCETGIAALQEILDR